MLLNTKILGALGLVCLALLAPAQARAQTETRSVTFDPSKETTFDAERVELLEGQSRFIAVGNVKITQPGVVLTSNSMEVVQNEQSEEIERLLATGQVRYASVSGDAIAGDEAVYVAAEKTLTVTGNVVLLRNGQVATGSQLTYNTETGAMSLVAVPGERVKGLLPQREEQESR